MKLTKALKIILSISLLLFLASCTSKKNYTKQNDGISIALESADLKLQVCTDKIIRVQYVPKDSITDHKSLVVTRNWDPVKFKVSHHLTSGSKNS